MTVYYTAGGKKHRDPRQWKRKEGSQFVESLTKKLNVPVGNILKTVKGRYGGTYAHWQIALAYAKYLSPEFHIWCNEVVKDSYGHYVIDTDTGPVGRGWIGVQCSTDKAPFSTAV